MVSATPTGQALNTMTDYKQWKDLLKAAGLREARLHDARPRPQPCCSSSASQSGP
jgi:hypothetical protein